MNSDNSDNFDASTSLNLEEILEKRELLDALLKQKYKKILTVVFTDLKGSTTIADKEGDLASRMLIKYHNDIVFSAIEKHKGKLVKSMGDGTLSYFDDANNAIYASIDIQKQVYEFNSKKKISIPLLIRIGMHTGEVLVEKNDIFGDVVNVASRFESSAGISEIWFSEETFNLVKNNQEISCQFVKTVTLKGKKDLFKAYKVLWQKDEIEKHQNISESEDSIDFEDATILSFPTSGDESCEESDEKISANLILEFENKPKQTIPLTNLETYIGRSQDCNIVLKHKHISRKHAKIIKEKDSYIINDLSSSTGMLINGKKTTEHILENEDKINFGSIRLTFLSEDTANDFQSTLDEIPSDNDILKKKALEMKKRNELFKLFLFCQKNKDSLSDFYQDLKTDIEMQEKVKTKFNDQNGIWFFKNKVSVGRMQNSDIYLSNRAISRVPITLYLNKNQAYFKINCDKETKVSVIELETDGKTQTLGPGCEYNLGKNGLIIFSSFFPIKYNLFKERFLILKILNPVEYNKEDLDFELSKIWGDFEKESKNILIVGT